MKKCKECGKDKNVEDFYKAYSSKDFYQSVCKECKAMIYAKMNNDEREKLDKYKVEYNKNYYEANKEKLSKIRKAKYIQRKKAFENISKENISKEK